MTREEEEELINLTEIGQIVSFLMNNQANEDFDGYSPTEMEYILYEPFIKESPVQFCENIPDELLDQVPMLKMVEYLMDKIEEAGELKLTKTGALPRNIVLDLYGRYIKDEAVERFHYKVSKETDSISVQAAHISLVVSKLIRKRNNKISLTRLGKSLKTNRRELFINVFTAYGQRFNLAFFDGYESQIVGNLGFAFSLILLSKFGEEKLQTSFYSDKYGKAFPEVLKDFGHSYSTPKKEMERCYARRTFHNFFNLFNLIEIEETPSWDEPDLVKKSAIFDHIFRIIPSNASGKMN